MEGQVGFTGTQHGLTEAQRRALHVLLVGVKRLHHGDCIGADADANAIAWSLGIDTEAWPGLDRYGKSPKRAYCSADVIHEALPYMDRNVIIASYPLIVCPKEFVEQQRGGTWSTFRRRRSGAWVVFPSGQVVYRP